MVKRKKYAQAKRVKKVAQPVVLPHDEARPTVAIVGGGASGIATACAVAACARARHSNVRVVILEQGKRLGSSILRSGNGRCNFSHEAMQPDAFNQPVFVEQVFQALEVAFSSSPLNLSAPILRASYENAVLQWFASLGLVWREAPLSGGALYPFSNKAASVLEVLQAELSRCGVESYCGVSVRSIEQQGEGLSLELKPAGQASHPTDRSGRAGGPDAVGDRDGTSGLDGASGPDGANGQDGVGGSTLLRADKVVYAAGGLAEGSHAGASLDAGEDLTSDALSRIDRAVCRPVLGPLGTSTEYLTGLDGVRARVRLSCAAKGFSEEGELLFRTYGISGIVVFNASRFVEPGDIISLDLVPERSLDRLRELLSARASFFAERTGSAPTATDLLRGFFLPEVAKALIQFAEAGQGGETAGASGKQPREGLFEYAPIDDAGIMALASAIKGLELEVKGVGDPKQCQVQRGGFRVDAVCSSTMETYDIPGLYLCGEALDVDGPCGGYNLHWAWSSGLLAGLTIADAIPFRERGSL